MIIMQKQVKQQLLQHGIQLEEFGGDIQAVEVSALKVLDPHWFPPFYGNRSDFS